MDKTFDLRAAAFAAVHRWWQAWVDRDTRAVEQMAGADYMERNDMGRIHSLGSGRLIEILSHEGGSCCVTDWELWDPVTRLFERVIVCSYAFRFSGRRGDQNFRYEGRATDVLSRQGDEWIFVSHEGVLEGGRLVS